MKSLKGFTFGLIVGLALAISSLGFAQNTSQGDKTKDSCCAMACCGSGDSCAMKHDSKDAAAKQGCCCCSGDSCDMKEHMKEQQKKEGQ